MVNRLSHPNCTRNITWTHVTSAHVMLRVQLGCESRFTIEFYGADSHFCHSAYVTWSQCQHASQISVVAHISWGELTWHEITWHELMWRELTWHELTWGEDSVSPALCTQPNPLTYNSKASLRWAYSREDFVCCLFRNAFRVSWCGAERWRNSCVMNWKVCGKKWLWIVGENISGYRRKDGGKPLKMCCDKRWLGQGSN